MRILFSFFISLLFLLTGCKTNYEVAHATKQQWFGGAAGSGGGVNYSISIEKPSKSEVKVDKVYVGDREKGQYVPFRFFNDSSKTTTMLVPTGVTLFRVEFAERIPGQRQPNMETFGDEPLQDAAPKGLPEDFNQGVVLFLSDGKGTSSLMTVQDFKLLEPLAYP